MDRSIKRALSAALTICVILGAFLVTAVAEPGEPGGPGAVPSATPGVTGAPARTVTFTFEENEYGETALYLPEGSPVTEADLLAGVTAADENGEAVYITMTDVDGLDRQDPKPRGIYPNPPYVITYEAEHPQTGDIFTATREVYVTVGIMALANEGESAQNPAKTDAQLRAAITNTASGGTVYVSGDFTLTATAIVINKNLTITGDGKSTTVITQTGGYNHFTIQNNSTVTIKNLTLDGNNKIGGGIEVNTGAVLTLTDAVIKNCQYLNAGGGIANRGTLTVENCEISGNQAYNAMSNTPGGGIYNIGMLTIKGGVTVSGNRATGNGGGIWNGGTVTVESGAILTLSGNSAFLNGGGIYNQGTVTVETGGTLTLSGNTANLEGGGIFNRDSATINNSGTIDNGDEIVNSGTITGTVTGTGTAASRQHIG